MSMLEQMKAMGAIAGLMKNKDRLREVGERARARIESARLTGEAGGGAVRVLVSGRMQVLSVHIDPAACAALASGARADVETLIADATNDALEKAQALLKEEAARAADELGLSEAVDLRGMMGNL